MYSSVCMQEHAISPYLIQFDEDMDECVEILSRMRKFCSEFGQCEGNIFDDIHKTYDPNYMRHIRQILGQMEKGYYEPVVIDNDYMDSEISRYWLCRLQIKYNREVAICAKVLGMQNVRVIFTKPVEIFYMLDESVEPDGNPPLGARTFGTQKVDIGTNDETGEPSRQKRRL